jgi:hypothetical protein
MELSASGADARRAATQELLKLLRNLKVYHRVHKRSPLVPILNQIIQDDSVSSCPEQSLRRNNFNVLTTVIMKISMCHHVNR